MANLIPIDCGNGCKFCDGYGIAELYMGPGKPLIAPCLICSPSSNLEDLFKRRNDAHWSAALSEEKDAIRKHNQSIATSGDGEKVGG